MPGRTSRAYSPIVLSRMATRPTVPRPRCNCCRRRMILCSCARQRHPITGEAIHHFGYGTPVHQNPFHRDADAGRPDAIDRNRRDALYNALAETTIGLGTRNEACMKPGSLSCLALLRPKRLTYRLSRSSLTERPGGFTRHG